MTYHFSAQTTLRHRFASYLETELALRGKKPADMLRKDWDEDTSEALLEAMRKSPVLFTPDAVANWLAVPITRIRKNVYGR